MDDVVFASNRAEEDQAKTVKLRWRNWNQTNNSFDSSLFLISPSPALDEPQQQRLSFNLLLKATIYCPVAAAVAGGRVGWSRDWRLTNYNNAAQGSVSVPLIASNFTSYQQETTFAPPPLLNLYPLLFRVHLVALSSRFLSLSLCIFRSMAPITSPRVYS